MPKVVFTNGCFDVLHPGHLDLLRRAKDLGDHLIVGLNSDRSVRSIKGPGRPVFSEHDRSSMLLALKFVDEVRVFDEATPANLIKEISPDVLVKGGDWAVDEIVGADVVQAKGGEVHSLPLLDGYSSTAVIEARNGSVESEFSSRELGVHDSVSRSLDEHNTVFQSVKENVEDSIRAGGEIIVETFRSGGKVLVCGNGGSAADAQHIAAEFVGRYETDRISLPSIALTTDTSALTAIGNDFGFDTVYSRQIEGLAKPGDCLIAISTSGNSPNVIAAIMEARRRECRVIGLTGKKGKKLASISDSCVMVPATRTARIQEMHILIAHIWCEMVDAQFTKSS